MISFKRLALTASLIAFLFYLSGCLVMMPLMMGGMFKGDADKSIKPEANETMFKLMNESVAALAANRGTYEQILLRKTEINKDYISTERFQQSLVDIMRLTNGWKIVDQGTIWASNSEDTGNFAAKSDRTLAVLDTQLYKSGGKLWLAMQLLDARSAELCWSGIYSEPLTVQG